MRIVFSRKGFDSAAGGGVSPIIAGQPVSLPIPSGGWSSTTYADLGLIALDLFTCGSTDPLDVLQYLQEDLDLGDIVVRQVSRFPLEGGTPLEPALAAGNQC